MSSLSPQHQGRDESQNSTYDSMTNGDGNDDSCEGEPSASSACSQPFTFTPLTQEVEFSPPTQPTHFAPSTSADPEPDPPLATLIVTHPKGHPDFSNVETVLEAANIGRPVTIGRSRHCTLHLPIPQVSSQHCRLLVREVMLGTGTQHRVFVEDLGSINGTFVNFVKMQPHKPYMLSHKDSIALAMVGLGTPGVRMPTCSVTLLFESPLLETMTEPTILGSRSAAQATSAAGQPVITGDAAAVEAEAAAAAGASSAAAVAPYDRAEGAQADADFVNDSHGAKDGFPVPINVAQPKNHRATGHAVPESVVTAEQGATGRNTPTASGSRSSGGFKTAKSVGEGAEKPSNLSGTVSTGNAPTIHSLYEIQRTLGSGANGVVKLGVDRQTGEEYAIKIIDKHRFMHQTTSRNPNLYAEVSILRGIHHPSITRCYNMLETATSLYMIMEYVRGGELLDRILEKQCYGEAEAAQLLFNILEAVKFLHDRNIVHRDLKPENILMASRYEDTQIKITDFGLAKLIGGTGPGSAARTYCGTPQYFAPEVLQRKNSVLGLGQYGKQADMWSIGVILYVLLAGQLPFETVEIFERSGGSLDFSEEVFHGKSQQCLDLVKRLLEKDVAKRLDVHQALRHPYILAHNPTAAAREKIAAQKKSAAAAAAAAAAAKQASVVEACPPPKGSQLDVQAPQCKISNCSSSSVSESSGNPATSTSSASPDCREANSAQAQRKSNLTRRVSSVSGDEHKNSETKTEDIDAENRELLSDSSRQEQPKRQTKPNQKAVASSAKINTVTPVPRRRTRQMTAALRAAEAGPTVSPGTAAALAAVAAAVAKETDGEVIVIDASPPASIEAESPQPSASGDQEPDERPKRRAPCDPVVYSLDSLGESDGEVDDNTDFGGEKKRGRLSS